MVINIRQTKEKKQNKLNPSRRQTAQVGMFTTEKNVCFSLCNSEVLEKLITL